VKPSLKESSRPPKKTKTTSKPARRATSVWGCVDPPPLGSNPNLTPIRPQAERPLCPDTDVVGVERLESKQRDRDDFTYLHRLA
jgi:hypothetical protein